MTSTPIDRVAPRPRTTKRKATSPAPKKPQGITVVVTRSTETFDFDAWADAYLRAVIALDAEQQRQRKDAA